MRYDGMVNQAHALVGKGHWLCRVVRLAMVGMPEKAPRPGTGSNMLELDGM